MVGEAEERQQQQQQPKSMTALQQLAWDHRRLNATVATLADLKHYFQGDELTAAITAVNIALKRIENLRLKPKQLVPEVRVAKRWSDTR